MSETTSFPLITANLDAHFHSLRKTGQPSGLPSGPPPVSHPMAGSEAPYDDPFRSNYVESGTVRGAFNGHAIKKTATGGGVSFSQPAFFSPVYTPINWQIPSKRREQYQWSVIYGSLVREDFTYFDIDSCNISTLDCIEDDRTGGTIFTDPQIEPVVSGSGELRSPAKFGVRPCVDKDCYRFRVTGNWRDFAVSEEHNVYLIDGKQWRRIKKADVDRERRKRQGKKLRPPRIPRPDTFVCKKASCDVRVGDYFLTPVPNCGDVECDANFAYLIGLIAADGSIHSGSAVNITAHVSEEIIIRETLDGSGIEYGVSPHSNSNESVRFSLSKKEGKWHDLFREFIVDKLTSKKFTRKVFRLNRESMLALLAGYVDGDGGFVDAAHGLMINTNSCDMADQLCMMFLMCGIRASVNRYPLYNDNFSSGTPWSYRVFIPDADLSQLASRLKSDKIPNDFVPRYRRELRFFHEENGIKYLAAPVKSVEHFVYTGIGWDMQIDPERQFVLSGHVVSNCRFFYENEPRVAAAIDFYARYPLSPGFELECEDRYIANYYKHKREDLELDRWMRLISHEVHLLGDCFPFLEVDCPHCRGSGWVNGVVCEHEGGSFKRIIILNPDFVEVFTNPIAPENAITLIPDDELKDLVRKGGPGAERLSPEIRNLVMGGQPIPLDNLAVSHLKYGESGYRRYGISMIRRLFPILSYKTKLMTAQWIVAERMIIPVKIVKVGTEDRPASPQDIADVQSQMQMTANDPNLVIVTHHAFEIEWVGAGSQVLQLSQEWEFINQEILDGLGVNKALLNAEGPVYASAAIGAEVMIQRLDDWRHELAKWVEQNIFLPIAKMRGFVKENEWGEKEYIYPRIKWNSLNLRDVNQERQSIMQLFDKGLISRKRVLSEFDIDPDVEAEQMKYERIEAMTEAGPGAGAEGGLEGAMGGGGGLDLGGGMPPAPGGDMGGLGGDMGGDMGGLGGEMGGAPGGAPEMGGLAASTAQSVNLQDYGGKVMKEKSRKKVDSGRPRAEEKIPGKIQGGDGFERDDQGRIWRTSLEIALEKGLAERRRAGRINHAWKGGFEVKHGKQPFLMDIAFPMLKIDVEADGETFHSSPDQMSRDKKRDMILRNMGWTVVRFRESEIEDQLGRVLDRIEQEIARKEEFLKGRNKK